MDLSGVVRRVGTNHWVTCLSRLGTGFSVSYPHCVGLDLVSGRDRTGRYVLSTGRTWNSLLGFRNDFKVKDLDTEHVEIPR